MRKPATITATLALLFGFGLFVGQAQADDPKPCASTSFKIAAVKSACERGGQPEAKKLMKAAVKKAKDAGESMNCKTCHEDLKTYKLAGANPVAELKKWL